MKITNSDLIEVNLCEDSFAWAWEREELKDLKKEFPELFENETDK